MVQIQLSYPVFKSNIHSLPLTFNGGRDNLMPELVETKSGPAVLPGSSKFGDFCTKQIWLKMGVLHELIAGQFTVMTPYMIVPSGVACHGH
jgi:hypothetical protein